jgi:hypothetical protein
MTWRSERESSEALDFTGERTAAVFAYGELDGVSLMPHAAGLIILLALDGVSVDISHTMEDEEYGSSN